MVNSTSEKLQEVHSVIVSLLTAEKKTYGIDVVKFDHIYKEAECEHIPFRSFGYSSLAEFLRTVPGVEIQSRNGGHVINFVGKESTRHLSQLVAKQRTHNSKNYRGRSSSCRPIASHYISRSRVISPRRHNDVADEILDIVREYPKGLSKSELLEIYLQRHPSSNLDSLKLLHQLRLLEVKIMVREHMVYPARNSSSYRSSTPRSRSIPPRFRNDGFEWKGSGVHEDGSIPSNFKVIPDSPGEDNDWLDDNNFDYVTSGISDEKKFDEFVAVKNTSPKKTTCNFVEESVTKACENNELEEHLPVKTAIESEPQSEPQPEKKTFNEDDFIFSKSQEHVATLLNKRTQFRLEKLIQNNPDGIWCIDLPKKYLDEYKISLDWENLGFQRIGDFAAYLPHIFHLVGPFRNGDFRLYDAKLPVPSEINKFNEKPEKSTLASLHNVYNSEDDEVEAVPSTIPLSLSNKLVPDDVMVNGESVGQISVTTFNVCSEISKKNSLIVIRVVEAFSPSFFWIHIEKKRQKFNDMMNNLQIFYEEKKAKYSIPIIILEKGLNVACMFFDKWHRGIIKAIDHRCQITVLFYDYGTVKTYPPDRVFYLHRTFSALPAQAIPCGLYGVRPLEGEVWPKNVIDSFIRRVYDRPLWATVGKLDIDTNSMLISLTDTSQDDDFHIIDWMFEKKYAKPGHMEIIDPKDLSHYVEDYGETPEVFNDYENIHHNQLSDNVFKLSPDVATVAVENLLAALTVSKKKANIVMPTVDCIDHQQKLLQTITLRYFEMILNMHSVMNPKILENMSEAFVKIILDTVRPELTIVQSDNANNLNATKSSLEDREDDLKLNAQCVAEATTNQSELLDVKLINLDELNDVNNIPMQSNVLNGPETIEKEQLADEILANLSLTEDKLKVNNVNGIIENVEQSNTDAVCKTKGTRRAQLELSIANTCRNFLKRHEPVAITNNSDVKPQSNFVVEELSDTNPFKKYIMLNMNLSESLKIPPPLPPRDKKIIEENYTKSSSDFINENGVKIVYEAAPVLYDLSKNDITYKSPVKTEFKFSETMDLKNIQSKCIEECQEIHSKTIRTLDISPNDDDKGYQSEILSSTFNDSELQQKLVVLTGEEDKLNNNSQINNKETIMNDCVSVQESSEKRLLFVKLTHNIVCIFCIEQEGWIPVNHFRSTFTTFGDNDGLYQFINITSFADTQFLTLKRADNLPLFNRYESRMFNWMPKNQSVDQRRMPLEHDDLTLIKLSSIIKILLNMAIITKEESDALRKNGVLETHPTSEAMANMMKLIKTYKSFRQQQSESNNWIY